MSTGPYVCASSGTRRQDVIAQGLLNGIDNVETGDLGGRRDALGLASRTLLVHCLRPLPRTFATASVSIRAIEPAPNQPVEVKWAIPAAYMAAAADDHLIARADATQFAGLKPNLLVISIVGAGGQSRYRLVIDDPGFDPQLSAFSFSFALDCADDVDCAPVAYCPPEAAAEPVIDYLNRDYTGLRQVLLDRLSVVTPAWQDRNAADVGVMLIELFAYLGDNLAAAQDSVAAEAYLGTARQRISLARHARLLDYSMHQGAAARTWLAVEVDADTSMAFARRNDCLPTTQRQQMIPAGRTVKSADGSVTFHTLAPITPRSARNSIDIYTWSNTTCCLPRGATSATLAGTEADLGLAAGEVLILEEIIGASTGPPPDMTHRWPVRLSADPTYREDPLTHQPVADITWFEADALPFALCCKQFPRGRCRPDEGTAVARGNVVLAGHGTEITTSLVPAVVPTGRYRPALERPGLAYAVPYDHEQARSSPAAHALTIDPRMARADIFRLTDGRDDWTLQPDLLGSDRFASDFMVEAAEDGWSFLRFGDDMSGRGPVPGRSFTATYRIGGGRLGNVGREILTVLDPPYPGVSVLNLMAAQGGADPEPVEQVRNFAPQAFRQQQRAVTDYDYAAVALRDRSVQRAVGTRRWTGSWYTEYVTVDRRKGAPVDAPFRAGLSATLDRYRLAGGDVAVTAPVFVPLDIVLTVCVRPGYFRGTVKQALVERFSTRDHPGGGQGFFHPDNFTFAQPIYLSTIVAAATSIPGVAWVDTSSGPGSPNRFQRWGQEPAGELEAGRILMDRLEVARCDSEATDPAFGRIVFELAGGL